MHWLSACDDRCPHHDFIRLEPNLQHTPAAFTKKKDTIPLTWKCNKTIGRNSVLQKVEKEILTAEPLFKMSVVARFY